MTKWTSFFNILATASGSERDSPLLPYQVAAQLDDFHTNNAARRFNMLPLPGGRGDLGASVLAEQFIEESTA